MVIDLLAVTGKICGFFDKGGEIMSCLSTFFSLTYSSKVSFIDLLENSVLKFRGKLILSTGGIVSFNPPVIDPLLAHPMINIIRKE